MQIRLAGIGDARAIAEAHVHGYQAAHRGIVPDAMIDGLSVDERTAQWSARLSDATASARRIWVCDRDALIPGFAATAPSRDADDDSAHTHELLLIYFVPEAWGRGFGRALTTHVIDDVRSRRARDITLWVFEANTRARRFYERAGFALDGGRKPVERGGATLCEIRYRRELR
jgi:GNAT superfamily N-acetyltransferase